MNIKSTFAILIICIAISSPAYLFLSFGLAFNSPTNIPNMEMGKWQQLSESEKHDFFTNNPNSLKVVIGIEKVKFMLVYQWGKHAFQYFILLSSMLMVAFISVFLLKKYNQALNAMDSRDATHPPAH